jgi:integrase
VSRGDILGAQQRLGHADAHTTLRIYSHAQPLADVQAAALLDLLYDIDDKRSTTVRERRRSGEDGLG